MKNTIKIIFSIILLGVGTYGFSQQQKLASNARISVLTCGEGSELYSVFGHSAFRIWDPVNRTDYVYNYGIFDYNAPNFYFNFVKGRPTFIVNKQEFPRFLFQYQYDKRWVKEQVLDLTPNQKEKLFQFLEHNIKPENREYQYDYLYNNCATKIITVLQETLEGDINFNTNYLEKNYTFRELLDQKLTTNTWASFGIDLALASRIDKQATPLEHTILPEYVMSLVKKSSVNGKPLVLKERSILKEYIKVPSINFLGTPFFWVTLLMLLVIFITYFDYKNNSWSKWLDLILFFITGIAGTILLLVWLATDHIAAANNYNLLWCFPVNIIAFLFIITKSKLSQLLNKYCLLLLGLLVIVPLIYAFGIQKFHPAFIPILLSLAIRYTFIWHKTKI